MREDSESASTVAEVITRRQAASTQSESKAAWEYARVNGRQQPTHGIAQFISRRRDGFHVRLRQGR
jgi:hypothetical protein